MLDLKTLSAAELRGALKATEEIGGKTCEGAGALRREIESRWAITDFIDRQSAIYLVGTALAAAGTRLAFQDGYALIVAGVLLIAPILVPLIPRRPVIEAKRRQKN